MIAGSLAIKSSLWCSSNLVLESSDFNNVNSLKSSSSRSSKSFNPIVSCNASSSSSSSGSGSGLGSGSGSSSSANNHEHNDIPKLEPFSRSKFERAAKDPPLIDKSEAQLADYCSTLEGENSYNCWQAYFELKDLEKESPKKEVERLIIEAGGVKSLIGCLHGVAAIHKANKEAEGGGDKKEEGKMKSEDAEREGVHVPGGLPKTPEELEEEETARMPDSDFTRMLRHRGKHAAWYSPTPDHQTD